MKTGSDGQANGLADARRTVRLPGRVIVEVKGGLGIYERLYVADRRYRA